MSKSQICLDFCNLSLIWADNALNEISIISNHNSIDKNPISKSDTFKFYSITLHYMFVLEATKLLEINLRNRNENFSSLYRLISVIKNETAGLITDFDEIIFKLNSVRETDFYKKIISLRDKKIAHSDRNFELGPLNFIGFTEADILNGIHFIKQLNSLLDIIMSHTETSFFLPKNTTTKNLMNFYEEYREFSNSKGMEFYKWKLNKNK